MPMTTVLAGTFHVTESPTGKEFHIIATEGVRFLIPIPQDAADEIGHALIDRVNPVSIEERPQDVIDGNGHG